MAKKYLNEADIHLGEYNLTTLYWHVKEAFIQTDMAYEHVQDHLNGAQ